MIVTSPSATMLTNNERAFLEMIGESEGTSTSPATVQDGYDVIVTGIDGKPEVFTDFSQHPFENRPSKVINSAGLTSNAAGKCQIMLHWWRLYKVQLKLPDFSPASQDAYYRQQLLEHRALDLLNTGNFYAALIAISGLWASLPGKSYVGQHQNPVDRVLGFYLQAGGTIDAQYPNPFRSQ